MDLGEALFQTANQLQIIFEGQIGMQAADDVEFRGAFGNSLGGALPNFVERKSVSAGGVGLPSKGAQFAMCHADIGGIDVAIDIEIGDVSVALFADIICEPANAEQVVRLIEGETVVRGETFASENFLRDRIEARILERGERLGLEL